MTPGRPRTDEIELSVFGSGIGESLLVHLGFDDWVVVDSCIVRETGQPAALDYLREIGVSPGQIRLVVATRKLPRQVDSR